MILRILFKHKTIVTLTLFAVTMLVWLIVLNSQRGIQEADVTSSLPFRSDWEISNVDPEEASILKTLSSQQWTFLGEGGQSLAFESIDAPYVLKLFKLNRFQPSTFLSALPDLPPFREYRQRHVEKRHQKLEQAFAGYKIAYDLHRIESGLLFIQLNPRSQQLFVTLKDRDGRKIVLDLQHIPFIVQLKGKMLGTTLLELLQREDVQVTKHLLENLFRFYLSEYAKGLIDLDRGLMHNIGYLEEGRLFHLDPGKISYDERMKNPERQQQELNKIALKVYQWLQRHSPKHASELKEHMQMQLETLFKPQGASNAA